MALSVLNMNLAMMAIPILVALVMRAALEKVPVLPAGTAWCVRRSNLVMTATPMLAVAAMLIVLEQALGQAVVMAKSALS